MEEENKGKKKKMEFCWKGKEKISSAIKT